MINLKIALVGIQNIKHMTTSSVYTDFLRKNNIDYDIIYMDKYDILEKNHARKVFRFLVNTKLLSNAFGRLVEALRFRKYAISIMNNEQYDYVILWREYAVFLFSSYVYRNYSGKYSVNIRDLWNKNNFIITYYIKKAIKKSMLNTVCSDGFIPHLPKADYFFLHCVNYDAITSLRKINCAKNVNKPIVITYIGSLRYYEYCCKVLDVFANDGRFQLRFIGQGSELIQNYSTINNYNNVYCKGSFEPENTTDLLEESDIINCAYGANSDAEKALLPIRFYYAIYLGIPILDTAGTWLEKKANELGVGITIPNDLQDKKDIANMVYDTYKNFDFKSIRYNSDNYIKEIEDTTKAFENKLKELIN